MVLHWTSTKIAIIDSSIRRKFAVLIKNTSPKPKPTVAKVFSDYSSQYTQAIIATFFMLSECYMEYPEVEQSIQDGASTEVFYREQAHTASMFQDSINMYPDLDGHITALNRVNTAIQDAIRAKDDPKVYENFVTEFTSTMSEYASTCGTVYEVMNFTSGTDFGKRNYQRNLWSPFQATHYHTPMQPGPARIEDHKEALKRFLMYIDDEDLHLSIITFVLVQSIGTAGMTILGNVKFPLFVNLFPAEWIISNRDNIWTNRHNPMGFNLFDDDPPQPRETPDYEHIYLLNKAEARLEGLDFVKLNNDYIRRSTGDKTRQNATPDPQEQEQQSEDKGKGKHQPESSPPSPPPGPSSSQQQPQAPDDTNYVPDPILTFKMKDFVDHIQGLQTMEMRLDHMTRFSRNDESAQQLSKWTVRSNDARTFAGNSKASKMFVITFTRKSRKPIFNPVS